MNSEAALISAVCQNKDIVSVVTEIDDDMFVSHKDVWMGLKSYYHKYNAVPEVSILSDRFTEFVPESVTGPTQYYVDSFKESYLKAGIKNIVLNATQSMKTDAPEAVITKLQQEVSSLTKTAHLVRDIDATDSSDAIIHYENLWERSLQMDGAPGIMTDFKAMDVSYPTGFAPGHLVIMLGYSARGKAEDVNKIIPTPDGYRRFGDLLPGDRVWALNGKPQKVLQIHPQGTIDAYRVTFSDGTSGVFSGDHLWSFYSGLRGQKRNNLMTMTTLEILERGLHHSGTGERSGNWKVRLPLPEPVQYDHVELPIDPYVLGYLLGDGSIGLIKGLGLNVRGDAKFIPLLYAQNSVEARLDLLKGLMDSGGSVRPGERAYFHNCNERLVEDVAELVRSLGGVAQKHFKPRSGKSDEYALSIWLPMNPFLLPRKADKYSPKPWFKAIANIEKVDSVEMMCITVEAEDHLYLTEDYTATHNTWLANYLAIKAWEKGFKPMMISMEMTPEAMRDRTYALMGSGLFNMSDLQRGSIDVDDFRSWANKRFDKTPGLVIVSNDGLDDVTIETIQNKFDEHRPDIVFVDYVQLMSDGRKSSSESERVAAVSSKLKKFAVRNNVPVVAISAVTMTDVTDVNSPPTLEQVRYSKSIQYDADLALSVHKYDDTNIIEVVSRKNRHGENFAFFLEVDFGKGIIKESYDAQLMS